MFTQSLYSSYPSFVLGFHGCSEDTRDKVLNRKITHLKSSKNDYDWLGHGIYFWENSPSRALEFAKANGIEKPAILGAIIDLGNCLDLTDYDNIKMVEVSYKDLADFIEFIGDKLPENKAPKGVKDKLVRHLDCAVIQNLHTVNEGLKKKSFDSVRGLFIEGDEAYPNAGFNTKNHIQLCVRRKSSIKGYFRPL